MLCCRNITLQVFVTINYTISGSEWASEFNKTPDIHTNVTPDIHTNVTPDIHTNVAFLITAYKI